MNPRLALSETPAGAGQEVPGERDRLPIKKRE